MTYEKVTPSKRNSPFSIPFLTVHEVVRILEDGLFNTSIEDYGRDRALRTRSYEAPFVPGIGSVDRNVLCLGFLPAFSGLRENFLNKLVGPTQDAAKTGQLPGGHNQDEGVPS